MRINPKMYYAPEETTPVETQEFDNRKIELYYMNDYDAVLNEYIAKGQFAAWSSVDGVNYRLFIEKGYYEKVGELYSQKINKIWVDFWDITDKISKNYSRKVLLPIGGVAILACIGSFFLNNVGDGRVGNYIAIGVLLAALIAMVFTNGRIKKKIMKANVDSRELIVKELGQEKFDALLDEQKAYMDAYYDALNAQYDEENGETLDEEAGEQDSLALDDTNVVEEKSNEATVIEAEVEDTKTLGEEVTAEKTNVAEEDTKEIK